MSASTITVSAKTGLPAEAHPGLTPTSMPAADGVAVRQLPAALVMLTWTPPLSPAFTVKGSGDTPSMVAIARDVTIVTLRTIKTAAPTRGAPRRQRLMWPSLPRASQRHLDPSLPATAGAW
jgi:hypothetical protein